MGWMLLNPTHGSRTQSTMHLLVMYRAKHDGVPSGPTHPTTDSVHTPNTKLASPHISSGTRWEKLHCTAALSKIPLRGFPKVIGSVQARTKRVL